MKPITRANFAIGAEKEKQYGYRINEKCIGCGLCTSKCPQNCIDTLSIPFRIRENNCLHCGNCMEVCPNNAVIKMQTEIHRNIQMMRKQNLQIQFRNSMMQQQTRHLIQPQMSMDIR